jgi:putative N6-adenine-specific DNA methylase
MILKASANKATWRPMHATCDVGLEPLLAAELEALGAADVQPGSRGVAFRGDRNMLWRANLQSRIASRILLPIAEFPARDRDALYRGVRRVDWGAVMTPRETIAVDARSFHSQMEHTGFIAQVVKDAIVDRMREATGRRPNVERRTPDVPVNVHLAEDHCRVSLDTSGARLHRRGYRIEGGAAPLRETLAAGMLALADWDGDLPLVDPFCGSGTILVEAALKARRFAPGLFRVLPGGEGFAFQRWRGHDREAFRRQVHIVRAAVRPTVDVPIVGSDTDAAVLDLARRNAERAGVTTDVRLERKPMSEATPPGPRGVVVTNPPYGERIGEVEKLVDLYRELGDTLKRRFPDHVAWVLVGAPELVKAIGLHADRKIPLWNGPIECRLLRFDLYAGSRV